MNKEMQYVGQGILLLFVVLAGMKTVQVLGSMRPAAEETEQAAMDVSKAVERKHSSEAQKGAALFKEKCATCHKLDRDLTGPALGGIEGRVKDKQLLFAWIRNSAAVLKTGDPYFTQLFKNWNQTPMSVFPELTDEQIGQILAYTREYKVTAVSSIVACR